MADIRLRPATSQDAGAVQTTYAFHVAQGTASFDTEARDAPFWRDKIGYVLAKGWPFLVAVQDGAVVGHAYTGPEAMRWHDGFIAEYPNAAAFLETIRDSD